MAYKRQPISYGNIIKVYDLLNALKYYKIILILTFIYIAIRQEIVL